MPIAAPMARYSYQVRIRRNIFEARPSRNRPRILTRNPAYTTRSRDHDCPPLTTVFNLMNADGGIGTAPSSTAARSSLPSSKDYLCPRLTQTSPLHCTVSTTPLGSTVCALALHAKTHAPTHTKSGTPTSTSTKAGKIACAHTQAHTRTPDERGTHI